MRIVKRIGDFIIKETNEKEREYNGLCMENYYIYNKDNHRIMEEYLDFAKTLDEAIKIVNILQAKKDFNTVNFAKQLDNGTFNWDMIKSMLKYEGLEGEYRISTRQNIYTDTKEGILIIFLDRNYVEIRFKMVPREEDSFEIKIIGVYK